MSLMKRRTMSDKQIAAARTNGSHSQGPATSKGRENVRTANLRHGLYSRCKDVVLEGLGEDPEHFERMRQGMYRSWPLAARSQPELIEELAVAMWKLKRITRRQEELQIQQALGLAGLDDSLDLEELFNPTTLSHLRSMESVGFREVIRIRERLLEIEQLQRKRHLQV
jgi:hypothetical protein